MGGEIGQTTEWSHDRGVTWELLEYDFHKGIQNWVKALNHLYTSHPALWRNAFVPEGYEWISGDDTENSVVSYLRKGAPEEPQLLVVCHYGTQHIESYTLGVPYSGTWREVLNSDATEFGGGGHLNGDLKAHKHPSHGKEYSVTFKMPSLSVMVFEGVAVPKTKKAEPAKAPAKADKSPAKKK
jgi:1,4-alpha-glucan branching enzyme